MLTDPVEIEIISKARQKNVRDCNRSQEHFLRIFADFLADADLRNTNLLDLGPGQFDFGVLARERGGDVLGLDNDPAVLELGRYKSFRVRELRLQRLRASEFDERFDGVICKFSINAFWFWVDPDAHRTAIRELGGLMNENAWGWIAPWNGVPKREDLSERQIDEVLTVQTKALKELGFDGFDLTTTLAKHYGVHGSTANRALFLRNLPIPEAVSRCHRL